VDSVTATPRYHNPFRLREDPPRASTRVGPFRRTRCHPYSPSVARSRARDCQTSISPVVGPVRGLFANSFISRSAASRSLRSTPKRGGTITSSRATSSAVIVLYGIPSSSIVERLMARSEAAGSESIPMGPAASESPALPEHRQRLEWVGMRVGARRERDGNESILRFHRDLVCVANQVGGLRLVQARKEDPREIEVQARSLPLACVRNVAGGACAGSVATQLERRVSPPSWTTRWPSFFGSKAARKPLLM
jgi:hypothetical protein